MAGVRSRWARSIWGESGHRLRQIPDQAAMSRLFDEAERHAQVKRARLGLEVVATLLPAKLACGMATNATPGTIPNLAGGNVGAAGGHAGLVAETPAAEPIRLPWTDARTFGFSRDTGLPFKEFRAAETECRASDFKDWPIAGPRTVKHVLTHMLDHGGSANGHHQAWRVACKFQPTDR